MAGYLEVPGKGRMEVVNGMLIGRGTSCAVVLQDNKASRQHARINVDGPVVEIEDLESRNGTKLNQKPVKRRMLRDGDVVTIGATDLSFHEGAVVAPEEVAAAPVVPEAPAPAAKPAIDDPLAVTEKIERPAASEEPLFEAGQDLFADDAEDEPVIAPRAETKTRPAPGSSAPGSRSWVSCSCVSGSWVIGSCNADSSIARPSAAEEAGGRGPRVCRRRHRRGA